MAPPPMIPLEETPVLSQESDHTDHWQRQGCGRPMPEGPFAQWCKAIVVCRESEITSQVKSSQAELGSRGSPVWKHRPGAPHATRRGGLPTGVARRRCHPPRLCVCVCAQPRSCTSPRSMPADMEVVATHGQVCVPANPVRRREGLGARVRRTSLPHWPEISCRTDPCTWVFRAFRSAGRVSHRQPTSAAPPLSATCGRFTA